MRPLLSTASTFTASTVDKVERLLEVLAALRDDPLLGSVFVLHGGTALNVFTDEMPRLSVDVDLMYVGQLEVSAMQTERPRVDVRLREVIGKLGGPGRLRQGSRDAPADSFRAVFLTAGRMTSPRLQVPPQEGESCRRIVVVEDANKLKQLFPDRSSRCRPCRSAPPLRPARPCRR